MKEIILVISILGDVFQIGAAYNFTLIASLPHGISHAGYNIDAGDTDHDGLNELIFPRQPDATLKNALEIWEHTSDNNYELVYIDTSCEWSFAGICDMDRDGLTDLVGVKQDTNAYTWWVQVRESPTYNDYPSVLTWEAKDENTQSVLVRLLVDFDRDGKNEIWTSSSGWPGPGGGLNIYENVGDNKNELVLEHFPGLGSGNPFPCDDFDGDGKLEIATWGWGGPYLPNRVAVFENAGDDTLTEVWIDTMIPDGGHDLFCGKDCDEDGKPEFFVNFQNPTDNGFTNYLIQYEGIGDNLYSKVIIDSFTHWLSGSRQSDCGDVDGDGIEEIVWSMGSYVVVLKATSNDQYERIWEWENDLGEYHDEARALCYDLNKNGYEEIVLSGGGETKIYEYDTTTTIQELPLTPIHVISLAPNPFRQTITLSYSLFQAGPVELSIYDLSGRCIKTLLAAQRLEPGVYSVTWDGKSDNGQKVASGVYFYRLETKDYKSTKKVVRLR